MASQCTRARAIAAGLTCGAGVVVPAAAFIATIPFEEAHAVVSACALPFAAGALAGAGVNALVGHMAMRGSERTAAAEAESHDYAATYNLGRYLTDYLNAPLVWDTEADAASWPEVEAMPAFPAAGSVALVDGTVVVKLS